jgi:hypothetical protein
MIIGLLDKICVMRENNSTRIIQIVQIFTDFYNGQEHFGRARLIGISRKVAKSQSFKFFLSDFAALRELDLRNIL